MATKWDVLRSYVAACEKDEDRADHQVALAHEALDVLGVQARLPAGDPLNGEAPASVAWRIGMLASRRDGAECERLRGIIDSSWRATGEYADKDGDLSLPDNVSKLVDKIEEQASELRYLKARDEDRKAQSHATPFKGLLAQFANALSAARGQRLYFAERDALRTAWAEVVEPAIAQARGYIEPASAALQYATGTLSGGVEAVAASTFLKDNQ